MIERTCKRDLSWVLVTSLTCVFIELKREASGEWIAAWCVRGPVLFKAHMDMFS